MIKIREAIVVEGRYDKNTLSQVVDAPIFETGGFGIFHNKELLLLLKTVAMQRGLIVFTDADGAGLVIRNRIKGEIQDRYLKHAYIPEILGKERRKKQPGKAGLLGVEGMTPEVIIQCLRRAGATIQGESERERPVISKQDLYELGLSGGKCSKEKRVLLMRKLQLPGNLSANGFLQAVNLLCTFEELRTLASDLEGKRE